MRGSSLDKPEHPDAVWSFTSSLRPHIMNRRSFLRTTTALTLGSWALSRPAFAAGPKRKILFFTKSSAFEHPVIAYKDGKPSFAERQLLELGPKHNWEFTFSKDGSLFNPQYLSQFDALFFYTTGDLCSEGTDKNPPMTPEGKQAFLDYVASGKGFIGTHSASDTFHTQNESKKGPDRYKNFGEDADPYVKMLGAEFIIHGKQQVAKMVCVDPKFPGLENHADGFSFQEEWYSLKDFRKDLHVLLLQQTDTMEGSMYQRPPYPGTWVRKHDKGRVFYTSMGHREDVWTNPIFQDVLAGGITWALGDVEADVTPNIEKVASGALTNPIYPAPAAAQ
jgi:type 1 glutamine amidotransferase